MSQLPDTLASFYSAITSKDDSLTSHIVEKAGLDGAHRLNIYQRSINGIHKDALASIYPTLSKLTGTDFFRAMCGQYIKHYPSPSGDLHQIGQHMADFLGTFKPVEQLPYLAHIAELEWQWHRVFHKDNCTDSNLHELASIVEQDQSKLIFLMRPASALVKSEYPLYQIWHSNQQDKDDNDETIDLDSGGENVIVIRINRDMQVERLEPDVWNFLFDIRSRQSLEELSVQHSIDELLPACVKKGWITHFKFV